MYGSKRVAVRDLNPHILCALCGGYLIQATTVIECLHSFCRSCIVKFLETSKICPICDAQIHKTRPLLNIRPDQTLQSLVYKLVPGLFQDEMRRRREFHATLSDSDVEDLSLEERGEASLEKEFKPGDDHVSLVLQLVFRAAKSKQFEIRDRRYLLCPSEVTVKHLKKFIRMKFQLNDTHEIEMYRAREELSDDLMLQDIALIYSWRREKPMNLCYTITVSPKIKSEVCLKQSSLVNKQLTTVCPTAIDAAIIKTETKPVVTPSNQEIPSSLTKMAPTVTLTPNSKCHISDPTSTSMTSTSTLLSTSHHSYSSMPITVDTTEALSSVCTTVGKIVSNDKTSTVGSSISLNIKEFKPPSIDSVTSESQSPAAVSLLVTSASETCKSKPGIVKHGASKLMHSVESILNKTSKRAHHKPNTSTLSWTPSLETQLSSSSNICKEKSEKTASKGTKHCQRELISNEIQKQYRDGVNKNPGCVGGHVMMAGIKRSQSVIETFRLGTEANGRLMKSPEVINNDHINKTSAPIHTENVTDVFSSYIPKLQKHLKLCAVKRSASYEGPSSTLAPPLGTTTCGDAMEKRNWKKRKLSTLDYNVSEVNVVVDKDTVNGGSVISTSVDSSKDSNQTKETEITSHKLPVLEGGSLSTLSDAIRAASTSSKSLASSHRDSTIPSSVSCLPTVSTQGDTTVRFQEKPQFIYSTSDAKLKSCSRKTNLVPTATSSLTTKNNNRTSCESKYNDSKLFSKIDQIKNAPSKRQESVSCSDNGSTTMYVGKKSPVYIQTKSNKSLSNKCVSTLSDVAAHSRSVEEICVDTSSSPSDVSNVTSPTTYVTSPGTEDRTDSSTLPEIQTSCDTNCVVTFAGKVVPLDLSVKKKK